LTAGTPIRRNFLPNGPGSPLPRIALAETPAYVVCHPGLARQVLTDFTGFGRTGLVYARIRTAMGGRT
jgi:hypothetical protein